MGAGERICKELLCQKMSGSWWKLKHKLDNMYNHVAKSDLRKNFVKDAKIIQLSLVKST